MDTRRLQHFVAVVDHGGFTAAAKAVFVSQPALSLAVKELEADLGTPLFDRIGRRVQLTAAGAALLGPARQVLRDLETGRAAVTAVSGLESGVLSLACLPTLAADPTATLVGRFRRHHPGVRVDLAAPEDSRDLFDLVETGRSELGLTDALDVPAVLESTGLGSQALVFILPPGALNNATESPALIDFRDTLFVASPEGTSTRRLLDERLGSVGLKPKLAAVSAQRDAILPLVLAGAGAALVPESMALVAEQLGAVIARPDPPAIREGSPGTPSRRPLSCRCSIRRAGHARSGDCSLDLSGGLVPQVLPEVRQGEVHVPVARWLDEFSGDEAKAVLAGIVHVYPETLLDVGHLRRAVVLRHCQQERLVDGRGPSKSRFVDQCAEPTECPRHALSGIVDGDVGLARMQPPGLRTDELDEEWVSTSALCHYLQGLVADRSPGHLDRLPNCPLNITVAHRPKLMAIGPTEKGQHPVVHHVADGRCQPSADERQLPLLPKGVLHRSRQFPHVGDLILVDLVERDEQPGLVLDEQSGKHLDLVPQTRLDDVGFESVPCCSAGSERAERDAEAAQVAVHGVWVEIPEQPGQMLVGDPLDETRRCRLGDDQPPLGLGAILDGVQQDGLPGPLGSGVERCSAGGSWPVLEGLNELFD